MSRSAELETWGSAQRVDAERKPRGVVADFLVSAGLASCSAAAWLPAFGHLAALRSGLGRRCGSLAEEGDVRSLHGIWFARLCRELLAWPSRAGLGHALARRVAWTPPDGAADGCVLAVCSSPWGYLLAACAASQPAIHLVIDGDWARRARPATVSGGAGRLLELAAQLRRGHIAAVIADAFGARRTCEATFLGRSVRASLLGARLAAAAGVPLRPVVFVWDGRVLRPRFGVPRRVARGQASQVSATVEALGFLEEEIRRTPAAWNRALKPQESW